MFLFQDKMLLVKEDMGKINIPTFKDVKQLIDGLEIKISPWKAKR